MDSLGIVIFKDGKVKPYGKAIYADQKGYMENPGHEESFKNEIVPSIELKLMGLKPKEIESFYRFLIRATNAGLMIIENRKTTSTDNDSIMCWFPNEPTDEQLTALEKLNFDKTKIDIYEFYGTEFDDYIEHSSFTDYIDDKLLEKHRKNTK